jgi:ferredoxin-like protein FixX
MKFYCDAERCIECNACVTACKNENDIPWGVNRRRVVTIKDGEQGERSLSVACMHCSDAPCAVVCPVDCFYTTGDGIVLHDKTSALAAVTAFTPVHSAHHSFRRTPPLLHVVKWTSAPSVRVVRKRIIALTNSRSMDATVSPKASYRCVPKCVRPGLCSRVMLT